MVYYDESRTMSDDEDNVDLDSDDCDDASGDGSLKRQSNNPYYSQAEKRAHHNALERKRRDHIKDSFTSLRDSVPSLHGEKSSRAQILKKAAEYIQFMRRKNNSHQQDIDDLKKQNNALEGQIKALERAKASGNLMENDGGENDMSGSSTDDHESFEPSNNHRAKKMKTGDF